ncbi:LPS translocon maturation chaperone LptM [Acinetobacter sp. WZC-1]|uniref:LPS translocon maturation chaperone LptM n=1 Tax=Acinetobacter sp. WZC-1 TaxID=3459034 RepID=UPI00403DECA7
MRFVMCCMSLLTTTLVMSGCGQSGALQLPNDPNHDDRAKYLLYSNKQQAVQPEQKAAEAKVVEGKVEDRAEQSAASETGTD